VEGKAGGGVKSDRPAPIKFERRHYFFTGNNPKLVSYGDLLLVLCKGECGVEKVLT
jgi:hypothetical protein